MFKFGVDRREFLKITAIARAALDWRIVRCEQQITIGYHGHVS
jgi:hypothetical protein